MALWAGYAEQSPLPRTPGMGIPIYKLSKQEADTPTLPSFPLPGCQRTQLKGGVAKGQRMAVCCEDRELHLQGSGREGKEQGCIVIAREASLVSQYCPHPRKVVTLGWGGRDCLIVEGFPRRQMPHSIWWVAPERHEGEESREEESLTSLGRANCHPRGYQPSESFS